MKKLICLLLFIGVAAPHIIAQDYINGRIVDAETHLAIPAATLLNKQKKVLAISDSQGLFRIPGTASDDSLFISSIGYTSSIILPHDGLIIYLQPLFANLNELVVSGNRTLQKRTEIPALIQVLSHNLINETKATRLDLLLNKIPGVYMVDLGNEQHSMSLRQPIGTKNLFLYLEDGVPIRTVGDFNHNALIEINQAALDRIEVIKGPASSLYGSEAIGGAINFITSEPSAVLSGKIQTEAGSRGYLRTDASISNTIGKLGVYAGGYLVNQDQAVDQHNNFYKAALTIKGIFAFNSKTKISAVADKISYSTDQKGGLDSAHFYSKNYNSFYRFTYRKVEALRIRSILSHEWNPANQTNLTFYFRNTSIRQNPFYYISNTSVGKAKGQINEDAFKSYGTILQHSANFPSLHAKLISGVSIDFSPASYFANYIDISRDANNVYYDYAIKDSLLSNYKVDLINSAVYTQIEFSPFTPFKIVTAARYDRLDYKFNNFLDPGAFTGAPDARDHFDHFTPKLGFTYSLHRNKGLYANYSVGFAPPNITDLYTGVKVPILKASSYKNYELGGWIGFGNQRGYAELSLYYMKGKNEIVSVRLADGSYQNQNAGETSHKGIELDIKYSPASTINIHLAGAYAEHKFISYNERGKDYSGNKMPQAPLVTGNAEITYKPTFAKNLRLGLEMQMMGNYYTDPQNTSTYSGFTIFNARAGYSIRKFELWMNCLNIFNVIYATTVEKNLYGVSYRPGQLRTVNAGLAYHFKHT